MSKAVTNEEVEDVLSSIRRLVSEDKRPLAGLSSAPRAPMATSATPAPEDVTPASGRLVLTPALRVAEDTCDVIADAGPLDLGLVARETWAPSDSGVDGQDDDGPLMLLPSVGDDAIDALVHDALEAQSAEDDSGLSDGDYSGEDYWDDEESDAAVKHTADHSAVRYADSTPEVASQTVTYDDEGDWDDGDVDDQWDVEPATHDAADATEALYFEEEPAVEPEAVAELEPSVQDANILTADVPLTAKIAALGAAIGKSPQDWEPDGDEANDLAALHAPAMDWEDDIELDATGAPLRAEPVEDIPDEDGAEPEADAKAPLAAAFGGDDQLMDEDALRDLVSEIVRSELQGALGERITRNVRKLVRREIHRALTAQEME